ncbi:MAG TPA: dihydrofolate reductase family protein, partial [Candidatus Dojkabacteria bacterium]|nr:dihydrofolate reductase family protein [Candidatus Dojkabacteria bacterium]
LENDNLEIIFYESEVDFKDLFARLRNDYKAERVTIQSGGTLNSVFLRKGLIDRVSIVVAPCLIGGKDTSSLIDGDSLISEADLKNIKSLTLESVKQLRDNYLHIIYNVNN